MDLLTLILLYAAGMLITLSPCILPVLPLMLSSGLVQDKLSPIKIGLGLAFGFSLIGTLLAFLTTQVNISTEASSYVFAGLLLVLGVVLVSSTLNQKSSTFLSPLASACENLSRKASNSRFGPYILGLMLGGIWSPCVGPLLGATFALTSTSTTLHIAAINMLVFGLGAATPLAIVAYLIKGRMRAYLPKIAESSKQLQRILGGVLMITGLFMITGTFNTIIIYLTDSLPEGWLNLITLL